MQGAMYTRQSQQCARQVNQGETQVGSSQAHSLSPSNTTKLICQSNTAARVLEEGPYASLTTTMHTIEEAQNTDTSWPLT